MSEAGSTGSASASPAGTTGTQTQGTQNGTAKTSTVPGSSGSKQTQANIKTSGPTGQAGNQVKGGAQSAPNLAAESTQTQLKDLAEDNMSAMVKVRVNGQVKTMSVSDALKLAEKADGADEKFRKSAEVEKLNKQVMNFIRAARENPDLFFKETGIDPDQYSQARLAKMLEHQMLTPEQRRIKELEQENTKFKETETQKVEREKVEKEQAEFKTADSGLRNELYGAWKDSGLPADPSFGIELAKTLLRARSQGLNWTPQQAAAKVKEDFLSNTSAVYNQMDPESLYNTLPKEVLKKIRDYEVQRVTGSATKNTQSKSPANAASKPTNGKKPMLSESEYKAYFANLSKR